MNNMQLKYAMIVRLASVAKLTSPIEYQGHVNNGIMIQNSVNSNENNIHLCGGEMCDRGRCLCDSEL